MKKIKNGWLPALLAVVVLYVIFDLVGVGCPIRYITGVCCPGCGMTRAWKSCLCLNFKDAFHFHPLFPVPAVALAVFLLRKKLNPKLIKALLYIAIAAFLVVYIIRMADQGNQVVVFEPETGAVFRLFKNIVN